MSSQLNSEIQSNNIRNPEEIEEEILSENDQNKLLFRIDESPSWHTSIGLGLQHYLVAISGVIGFPIIIAPHLCIPNNDEGDVVRTLLISSLFFVSGICTFLQTTFGVRLPIMQGATFTFLPPAFAILALPQNVCPAPLPPGFNNSSVTLYNDTDGTIVDGTELWQRRMRQVQGSIAVASILQLLLGITGAIGFLLRYIGPLTIASTISLVGLSLLSTASYNCAPQWGIAAFTIGIITICSQYLPNIKVPYPSYSREKKCHAARLSLFKMFPVLIGLVLAWILSYILTVTDVFSNDPSQPSYRARTDLRSSVISNSPWFYWPYPGQWGLPVVTVAGVIGMMTAIVADVIDSIGDYYACARICNVPMPPKHAINRGLLTEGFGCVLAGLIGTGTATTSFSENVGAIAITRVGSRRVLQVAGIACILLGVFSKFGSIFVTIPDPVVGGLFCVTFGMITAVGISNLQYVDMNSPRNVFIIGTSIFVGLTVPEWMKANTDAINTSVAEIDQILIVALQTPMLIGGLLAFFFDNTIPGTEKERGMHAWEKIEQLSEQNQTSYTTKVYNLPFPTNCCRFSKYIPFLQEYESNGLLESEPEKEISISAL